MVTDVDGVDLPDRRESMLYLLFALLADKLAKYGWSRERVWKRRVAAFEFEHSPECRISFDVFIERDYTVRLHVVARDERHGPSLAVVLGDMDEGVGEASGNGARFDIPLEARLVERGDLEQVAEVVSSRIQSVRHVLSQWCGHPREWVAADGAGVRYIDRPGRSYSDRLVVIFSSIRSKRYWVDFGGPYGDALRGVRSRILFVLDDAIEGYDYHLRRDGSEEIEEATLEFLVAYMDEHGIAREHVLFAGMSKGATAAICLGSRVPEVHVLASVPQMSLGKYLAERGDGVFSNMFGAEPDAENVASADSLVPARFQMLLDAGRPTTVLTSPEDTNCSDVLLDESQYYREYSNLNLMLFDNPAIVDHVSTLRYATPAFLGMITLFAMGVSQYWQRVP